MGLSMRSVSKLLLPKNVRKRRYGILGELRKLQKKHSEEQQFVKDKLKALEQRCPHGNVVWYPDPAGGNDSSYECIDCGRWSRSRFP
jgi:hypothetical protein